MSTGCRRRARPRQHGARAPRQRHAQVCVDADRPLGAGSSQAAPGRPQNHGDEAGAGRRCRGVAGGVSPVATPAVISRAAANRRRRRGIRLRVLAVAVLLWGSTRCDCRSSPEGDDPRRPNVVDSRRAGDLALRRRRREPRPPAGAQASSMEQVSARDGAAGAAAITSTALRAETRQLEARRTGQVLIAWRCSWRGGRRRSRLPRSWIVEIRPSPPCPRCRAPSRLASTVGYVTTRWPRSRRGVADSAGGERGSIPEQVRRLRPDVGMACTLGRSAGVLALEERRHPPNARTRMSASALSERLRAGIRTCRVLVVRGGAACSRPEVERSGS